MIERVQKFENWLFDLPAFVGVPIMLLMIAIMILAIIGAGALIVYIWWNGIGPILPYILVGGLSFTFGWVIKR